MKALTRSEFDALLGAVARAIGTQTRPVAVPGEAILGIEAVARCCAGPGRRFLNLVTGPYGLDFGRWLRGCGAEVMDLKFPYDEAADPAAVERAAAEFQPDALSYVYAEAVTGGANPAEALQEVARRHGMLTIVDAVSSVGADPFAMDDWGVDVAAVGMQKALLGSNGISFLGVSLRAMEWMRANPDAPRHSVLSVPELFDQQAREVPAHISVLEARCAADALEEIEALGGVDALVRRQREMASLVRREARAMGYSLFQKREEDCTNLNTALARPRTPAAAAFRGEGIVSPGSFGLEDALLRVNHYGAGCTYSAVEDALRVLKRLT